MGRPGLEPGTNPESFRGCSVPGVAPRFQRKNCQARILFTFELAFKDARFCHGRKLLCRREFYLLSKPPRCMIAAAHVLGNPAVKVIGGTNIISTFALQDVNPSVLKFSPAVTNCATAPVGWFNRWNSAENFRGWFWY
ncbi:MAG: hypothetical protein QOG67_1290 [Verrucomicrobiota bacterium]